MNLTLKSLALIGAAEFWVFAFLLIVCTAIAGDNLSILRAFIGINLIFCGFLVLIGALIGAAILLFG